VTIKSVLGRLLRRRPGVSEPWPLFGTLINISSMPLTRRDRERIRAAETQDRERTGARVTRYGNGCKSMAIKPIRLQRETMLKKLLLAGAAVIACAGTARAADCQLAAAALFPNTLDAFENVLRERFYQKCMAGQLPQQRAVAPQPKSRPIVYDCHFGKCSTDFLVSTVRNPDNTFTVNTRIEYDCSGSGKPCPPNLPTRDQYKVRCVAPGFVEYGDGTRVSEPEADPPHATRPAHDLWFAVCNP
jgi:hypothetical protein